MPQIRSRGQTETVENTESSTVVNWQQRTQDPAQHGPQGHPAGNSLPGRCKGQRRVQVSVYVAASLQQQCHRHCIGHKPSRDLRAALTASKLCTRMIPPVSRRLPFSEVLRDNGLVSILTASLRISTALCCPGAFAKRLRLSGTSPWMCQQGRGRRCMPALAFERPHRTRHP